MPISKTKRDKGLCFHCNEKFLRRPSVQSKGMRMFIDDEKANEVEIFDEMEPKEETNVELQVAMVDATELSLTQLWGFHPKNIEDERVH